MSHILSMSFQFYFVQKRAMLSKLVVHLKIKYKIVVEHALGLAFPYQYLLFDDWYSPDMHLLPLYIPVWYMILDV